MRNTLSAQRGSAFFKKAVDRLTMGCKMPTNAAFKPVSFPRYQDQLEIYVPVRRRLGEQWESFGYCAWCGRVFLLIIRLSSTTAATSGCSSGFRNISSISIQTVMGVGLQLRQGNFGPHSDQTAELRAGKEVHGRGHSLRSQPRRKHTNA